MNLLKKKILCINWLIAKIILRFKVSKTSKKKKSLVCVQNCNSCGIRSAKRGHLDSTLRRTQNLILIMFGP